MALENQIITIQKGIEYLVDGGKRLVATVEINPLFLNPKAVTQIIDSVTKAPLQRCSGTGQPFIRDGNDLYTVGHGLEHETIKIVVEDLNHLPVMVEGATLSLPDKPNHVAIGIAISLPFGGDFTPVAAYPLTDALVAAATNFADY